MIKSGIEFKQTCLKFEHNRTENLWDELWQYIHDLTDLDECADIKAFVPGGMLLYRFNEKAQQLAKEARKE